MDYLIIYWKNEEIASQLSTPHVLVLMILNFLGKFLNSRESESVENNDLMRDMSLNYLGNLSRFQCHK